MSKNNASAKKNMNKSLKKNNKANKANKANNKKNNAKNKKPVKKVVRKNAKKNMKMKKRPRIELNLSSNSIKNKEIPITYACAAQGGKDQSPHLRWGKVDSPEVKSYAILVEDPDAGKAGVPANVAPKGIWVHWILTYVPKDVNQIPILEAKEAHKLSYKSANKNNKNKVVTLLQGYNTWKRYAYGGPCPPPGTPHRYFFDVYALDTILKEPKMDKAAFMQAIRGHVVAKGGFLKTFENPGK